VQRFITLCFSVLALLSGLGLLFYISGSQWRDEGVWTLAAVVATLGMGHGALDAILLAAQFRPHSRAVMLSSSYLMATLLAGWFFSYSFSLAIISLLIMSVWHFGEEHQSVLIRRVSVGGASVMAPALSKGEELGALLKEVAPHEFSGLLEIWSYLAWAWLLLLLVYLLKTVGAVVGSWKTFKQSTFVQDWRAIAEISVVGLLSFLLNPLALFTLFFGGYHCVLHITRVKRAINYHQGLSLRYAAFAWSVSMFIVTVLMSMLWFWLKQSDFYAIGVDAQVLHWLVVALAAVTVPHLILVTYSKNWLNPL